MPWGTDSGTDMASLTDPLGFGGPVGCGHARGQHEERGDTGKGAGELYDCRERCLEDRRRGPGLLGLAHWPEFILSATGMFSISWRNLNLYSKSSNLLQERNSSQYV